MVRQCRFERVDLLVHVGFRQQAVGEPKRQAVHEHRGLRGRGPKGSGKIVRRLDSPPAMIAPGAMGGDTLLHLGVPRFGRGQIDPRRRPRSDKALGIAALA
jgi:hypothetical protein